MFKWIVTFIFTNLMVTIYTQPPVILTNSIITNTEQAEAALAKIVAKEALPVVLFELRNQVHPPDNIDQVVTVSGKMIKGTTFSLMGSQRQIFYCPKPKSISVCLLPQEFKDAELLQCTEEPTPVVLEKEESRCGFRSEGITNFLVYEICEEREGYTYKKSVSTIYGFCFDKQKGKTLFTTHYILVPKLLESKLLLREQQVHYTFSYSDLYNTANAEEIKNSLDSESRTDVEPSKRFYQVQKLVPNEDMAFATWSKTTYQYVNAELQHYRLFHIWNKMNENVRKEAIQMYNRGINLNIRTGIFDVSYISYIFGDQDQIYNIWIKIIISKLKTNEQQGVAILMNNFLNVASPSPQILLLQNKIEGYCPDNLCANDFIDQFTRIAGVARCCHTTREIRVLFSLPIIDLPLLHIPGVV